MDVVPELLPPPPELDDGANGAEGMMLPFDEPPERFASTIMAMDG